MKKIICLVFILLLTACTNERTLDTILETNNYIIVDVRTKSEYQESHIKDAVNIPYDIIDEEIELAKDKTILVYCKSGKRSNMAAQKLKDLGYDVYDLGAFETIDLEKE